MSKRLIPLALLFVVEATSAAYMPSVQSVQGDRIRVRGENGVEVDQTIQPDMQIQFGVSSGIDSNKDNWYDNNHRYQDRYRNEKSIYIQAVVPINFNGKKKVDPHRLYELELRHRAATIERMEQELILLRAAASATETNKTIFSEG